MSEGRELPTGWKWFPVKEIALSIQYGYTESSSLDNIGPKFLRITDIQNNTVNWNTVPGCDAEKKAVSQYILSNKDILIARTGGTVGKSYLVRDINVVAVFASYLIRVIPSACVDVRCLKYFTDGPLYWKQLYAACSGTGQPNVNG